MPKLYTRTGDKGQTGLLTGERCNKGDPRVEAYGTIDELNSAIAVAVATIDDSRFAIHKELDTIQRDLFHIGTILAGGEENQSVRHKYLNGRTAQLEKEIDKMQEELPAQTQFYLPGGSQAAARLDFARAVARRAERRVAALSNMDKALLKYINRLSDYLYALARWVNFKQQIEEQIWEGKLKKV